MVVSLAIDLLMTDTPAMVAFQLSIAYDTALGELFCFFFIDINECSEGVAECEQNCHNNNGSYTCSCSAGYELADDGFHCTGKLYNHKINIHEGKVNNNTA